MLLLVVCQRSVLKSFSLGVKRGHRRNKVFGVFLVSLFVCLFWKETRRVKVGSRTGTMAESRVTVLKISIFIIFLPTVVLSFGVQECP